MNGKQPPVDRREFEARLSAVCGGGVIVLPRKQRDRHILFRAIAQTLESKSPYSERELNSSLREWIGSIGLDASLDCVSFDCVSLRRYLVENGYLLRDEGGRLYTVRINGNESVLFDSGIEALDPDYSWDMLIRASNPAFSCGRSPVSLEPLSIRLNRLENRTIEPVINRFPARGTVTRQQVDFPVRNPHRFGPFHGPDASSVHYPGAQDTRASLCHNSFQSVAP